MSDAFPLDFDGLVKGDVISQDKIESIFMLKASADPQLYRCKMLRLVEMIKDERSDLYPRTEGNTVVIMTDEQASEHSAREMRRRVNSLANNATDRSRINRGGFTEAQRRAEEHRDLSYASTALAARNSQRKTERHARLLSAKPVTALPDPDD